MDGGEPQGIRWPLVGDMRRSGAGSGRHRDDGRVPPEVAFVRFGWVVGKQELGHSPKIIPRPTSRWSVTREQSGKSICTTMQLSRPSGLLQDDTVRFRP